MPNVSTLTVRLSANSAKLVAELSKAQRRARTFSDRVSSSLRFVRRSFALLAPAAITAFGALTQSGLKSGDQLAKTADKLGVTAKELAGLRFAAEQTGVGIKQLDLGLQRMVRRVAEAAKGTGEAQGALKELNIDAKALARLSPDEQFRKVADAFESVANQSDKVRLGFKLFDSEGVALVNTLAAGRDGLVQFTDEAVRLGLALEDVQLRNIQEAADAQNRMSRAFAGLGRQLAAVFAPAMEAAADSVAGFVSRITQGIPKMAAFASAVFGISRAVENLTLSEARTELTSVLIELADAQQELIKSKERLEEASGRTRFTDTQRAAFIELGRQAKKAEESVSRLTSRSSQLMQRLQRTSKETETLASTFAQLPSGGGDAAVALFKQASDELDRFIEKQESLRISASSIFDQTRTPIENFVSRMREAREVLNAGFISEETFERFRTQLLDGVVKPIRDTGKSGAKAFSEIQEASRQAARNIQDSFAEFFFDPFKEGLNGLVKAFADAIRRMLANQLASQLFKFLSKSFGPLTGGIAPPRALGGPVTAGSPFLVGERGPELFVPSQSGSIVPNNKLGSGGVFIVQNFNIEGGVTSDQLSNILPAFGQQVKQETIALVDMLKNVKGRL